MRDMKIMMPRLKIRFERWKWSKEFNMYVSNFGHFRDIHRQPIPQYVNHNGYMSIQTAHGFSLAHRVVMKTWRPVIDMDHLTVDHLDHNKRDNSIYNLEWVIEAENRLRANKDKLSQNQEEQLALFDQLESKEKKFTAYKDGNLKQPAFSCLLLNEAVKWCASSDKSFQGASNEAIAKGISNSVQHCVPYGGYVWRYE